ncbi:MAG: energy transducer TonB [Pseudomonadota bacterium]
MLTSLALHALLLFLLPVLREAQTQIAVPPLTARLAAPKPPAPVAHKFEPPPVPTPVRPAPVARAAPPAPVLRVESAKQAAEPVFMVPAAPAAPAPVAPQVLVVPQALVARAEPQPLAQAASGPDPGTIARFRLELMDLARRYKKYPRIAQDNNWEGRVELRIAIAEDGAISSLVVKKGAGRSVLDEEAQAMIRTAKSKVTIPPGLRGKAFVLEIPVDFFLKEEEK